MGGSTDAELKTGFARRATLVAMLFVLGVTAAVGIGKRSFQDKPNWNGVRTEHAAISPASAAGSAEDNENAADLDIEAAVERLRARDGGDEGLLSLARSVVAASEVQPDAITEDDLALARSMLAASSIIGAEVAGEEGAVENGGEGSEEDAATDNEQSDEERVKAAAEASASFWKLAWQKSWPFLRLVSVGVWHLAVQAWDAITGMITIEPVEEPAEDAADEPAEEGAPGALLPFPAA